MAALRIRYAPPATGLGADFSDTSGVIQGPPLVVGDSTEAILTGLGYSAEEIRRMAEARIIGVWHPGEPQITAFSSKQRMIRREEASA